MAMYVLHQSFPSNVSTSIIYNTNNKVLGDVTWTGDLIGIVLLLASLFCCKYDGRKKGGEGKEASLDRLA